MRILSISLAAALLGVAACSSDPASPLSPSDSTGAARAVAPAVGQPVQLVSALSPTLCAQADDGGTKSGSRVRTATCSASEAQRFTLRSDRSLRTAAGLCLAIGGVGANGAPAVVTSCRGSASQQWTINGSGSISAATGKCLDVQKSSRTPGTPLIVWSCQGTTDQRWTTKSAGLSSPDSTSTTTPPPPSTPTVRVGKYVAPNGSSSGSGTIGSPLDLATALKGGRVSAGDTVWVRGGTYRGSYVNWLSGTSSARITVRAYPGERATIDGDLIVMGSYVTFWGLEVMRSNPVGSGALGINVKAPHSRFVNMVVHDAAASGMGVWTEAPNAEVYGSLIYNNGTHPNLDHGLYVQGNDGTKYITDNVIFNNWTYGLHIYTGSGGYIRNMDVRGNTSFNNGTTGPYRTAADLFIGGETAANNITFADNNTFRSDRNASLSLGYANSVQHGSLTVRDNYVVGLMQIFKWSPITNSGNTVVTGTPSSGTRVVVRPNKYEAGRANVTVYNWSKQGSVTVDLSKVLRSGDRYVVKNVLNFYGAPVASGTFGGGSITIPITAVAPPPTLGRTANVAPSTGTQFNVYVVMRADS